MGRLLFEIRVRSLFCSRAIMYRKFKENFKAEFSWPQYLPTPVPPILLKSGQSIY